MEADTQTVTHDLGLDPLVQEYRTSVLVEVGNFAAGLEAIPALAAAARDLRANIEAIPIPELGASRSPFPTPREVVDRYHELLAAREDAVRARAAAQGVPEIHEPGLPLYEAQERLAEARARYVLLLGEWEEFMAIGEPPDPEGQP